MSREKLDPVVAPVVFGSAGLLIVLSEMVDAISVRVGFVALTCLLLLYLCTQVMRVRRVHPERWLLNPAVLCSTMTFFMGFGISNVLFFLPAETLEPLGMVPDVTPAMLKLMWLVLLGAIGMWMGYWSRLAAFLSNATQRRNFARVLRKSNQLQPWAVPALLAVSLLSRVLSVQLGLFGYSSSYGRLIEMGSVTQYLALLSSLGKLALVVIALEYYSSGNSLRTKFLFFAALFLEVFFGLLSGFKAAVVMPFIIVGACQYLKTNRLPRKWILFVFIGVFAAFQIIEPFRSVRNSDSSFKGASITEIAGVLVESVSANPKSGDDGSPGTAIIFFARSSLAYIGSLGIEFADQSETLPSGSPNFLENILLSPLYAWIPRFIWSSKPVGDLGLWYTQVVVGHADSFSSTAMSPFTFLYFTGGALAVFLGFLLIGITQRLFLFLTQPNMYLSGAVVFLGMLQSISVIGDSFDGFIILLMRELPLLIVLQRIIYRARPSSAARQDPIGLPHKNVEAGRPAARSNVCAD